MPKSAPSLLVVDDQPASIAQLRNFLSDKGLDLTVADTGEEGLALAVHTHPDLILLDVLMPGMNGFAVCEKLKSDPRTADIPVIFLSASRAIEDKLQGFALGGVDYIPKPFVPEEVLARIFVQLQTRRRLARLEAIAGERALVALGENADRRERDEYIFAGAANLLRELMGDPPGLVELAHRLGTNERRLNEIFHHRVGMPVFDYLAELRLETGRGLLKGSQIQIQLIAECVGYQNAGDFSRAFRRRYQLTPREYRRACGEKQATETESLLG